MSYKVCKPPHNIIQGNYFFRIFLAWVLLTRPEVNTKGPSKLHMAKNLSTKSRRSVDEVSAKDFSSPAKFFDKKNFVDTLSPKNF